MVIIRSNKPYYATAGYGCGIQDMIEGGEKWLTKTIMKH